MKSLEKLTGKEQLLTSTPFFVPQEDEVMNFTSDLLCDYEEPQIREINTLVKDNVCMSIIRFMEFLSKAETDKQLIARFICLQKLFDNRHGNWIKLCQGHDVTIKTVRSVRDKIYKETGLHIQ